MRSYMQRLYPLMRTQEVWVRFEGLSVSKIGAFIIYWMNMTEMIQLLYTAKKKNHEAIA